MARVLGSFGTYQLTGKPRRACSAYNYYVKDNYRHAARLHDEITASEAFSICFERWKQEDEATKAIYNKLAAEDKERYQREMKMYYELIKKGVLKPPPKKEHVRNAYDFFCKEVRKKVHEDNPTVGYHILKILGKMWRELPSGDKQRYKAMVDEEKRRRNRVKDEKKREKKIMAMKKCRQRLDRLNRTNVPAPELVEMPP